MIKRIVWFCLGIGMALNSPVCAIDVQNRAQRMWQKSRPWLKIATGVGALGIHGIVLLDGRTVRDFDGDFGYKVKTILEETVMLTGLLRDPEDERIEECSKPDRLGNCFVLAAPVICALHLIRSGLDELYKPNTSNDLVETTHADHQQSGQKTDVVMSWYLAAKQKIREYMAKFKKA